MKKKTIYGLCILASVLLIVFGLMICKGSVPLASKSVTEIYNTILFDEDLAWDLKTENKKVSSDYEDYYEAEFFFEYQPKEVTDNMLQIAYKNIDDSYLALSVLKIDTADKEGLAEYEEWLNQWIAEKKVVMLGADDENFKVLQPYLENSALVEEDGLFIILYGPNGFDILSKYFDDVKSLFYIWR